MFASQAGLADMQQQQAQDPGDFVQLQIPRTNAVAIHFPGYVSPESPAAALATFGGEARLSAALADQVRPYVPVCVQMCVCNVWQCLCLCLPCACACVCG